jgi:uncharacterized protein YqcC (DUF446 family)
MATHAQSVAALLDELSVTLKSLNLWQSEQPSDSALASTAPFCCDALPFEQWLQFVFIPKMNQIINQGQPLPNKIALTPIAEESFKSLSTQSKPLLLIINKIDNALTGQGK